MSHLAPFRLNVPNIGTELSSGVSNPKKRRKNVQQPIQTPPNVQDLLPPPLSGYGDTIVASNPFDDCPSSVNSMPVRNNSSMGMGSGMGMVVNNINICRPMGNLPTFFLHFLFLFIPFKTKFNFYTSKQSFISSIIILYKLGPSLGSPILGSPNPHQNSHMMNNPMMMNGPRMNGPMGNHMGPHMMPSPNGSMHSIGGTNYNIFVSS